MNKFKKIMLGALSVLTLGLFAVVGAGTRVEAKGANEVTVYNASNDTAGKTYAYNDTISTANSYLTVTNNYNSSKKATVRAVNTSLKDTSNNKISDTYTNSLYFDNGGSSSANYKLTVSDSVPNTQKIKISVYFSDMNSSGGSLQVKDYCLSKTATDKTGTTTKDICVASGYFDAEDVVFFWSVGRTNIYEITYELVNTYTISFDTDGGSSVESQTIVSGQKVTEPDEPTKAGSIFNGWKTRTGTEGNYVYSDYNFNTAVNSSFTLYASWTSGSIYTITFTLDGSTYAERTVNSNDPQIANWPTDPYKMGYEFLGWYNGETLYDDSSEFNGDLELTARFSDTPLMISQGSSVTLSYDEIEFTSGNDSINSGKFFIVDNETDMSIDSAIKFNAVGNTTKNYIAFIIPGNSIAKIVFEKYRATSDSSTATLTISDGTTSKSVSTTGKTNLCRFTTFENTTNSPKTIYIYRSGSSNVKLNILKVSVSEYSSTKINSNAELGFVAQYNGTAGDHSDATKLRLVGTIYGIELADYQNIKSATFTFTFNDANRTGECTQLYSSVASLTELFSGGDNIMYVVFNLNNINKSGYSGKVISNLKFTVEFNDADNTKLEITHNNITLPTFA